MEDVQQVDSITAARALTRTLLKALLVGLVTGGATWLFLVASHLGEKFLWETLPEMLPSVPSNVIAVSVVIVMTLGAALTVALCKGRPFDTGHAEAEYSETGRMEYRKIIPGAVFSLFSLFSGAAVGPEAPLTDINGGLGTLIAEKLKCTPEQIRTLTYAGVAGAFGAFFGAAPVGAILALELISPRLTSLSRSDLAAGLASGGAGWTVFMVLGGAKVPLLLDFPDAGEFALSNLLVALAIGVAGGIIGLVYGAFLQKLRHRMEPVRRRPWLAALLGGIPVAVAALGGRYLLFSGQSEVPDLVTNAATIGVLVLVGLGLAKLLLSSWSLSTAYFGGPIFPLIFAGTCFGLALHIAFPSLPEGVAVMAMVAGMVCAAAAAPLSITLFLALITNPVLASSIAVSAVAAYVVRQAIAPTLPGVYRIKPKPKADTAAEAAPAEA